METDCSRPGVELSHFSKSSLACDDDILSLKLLHRWWLYEPTEIRSATAKPLDL